MTHAPASSSAELDVGPLRTILDQELRRFVGGDPVLGCSAALAVGDARALHVRGLANRQTGWPVRADSLFMIGSVQKTFTATLAAGRLLEGKLAWSGQVTRDLPPEVAVGGTAIRQVTIEALATMTAAMPSANIPDQPAARLYRGAPPPAAAISWWQRFNPERLIGAKYAYANASEVTLGFATANAAGRSYPELFEHELRAPLGMTDTVLDLERFPAERIAIGYRRDGEPLRDRGVGFNSTAPDMLRFLEANLFRLPAMPPLTTRAMALAHEPRFQISPTRSIGMVWYTTALGERARLVEKSGSNGGFVAWIGFIPEEAAALVILCNGHPPTGGPNLAQIGEQILCRATAITCAPDAPALDHPDGGLRPPADDE